MSIYAYSLAVRNHLRANLTNFYERGEDKFKNCRVMLNDKPAANCGQEFLAVYGSTHQPRSKNLMQGLEEVFGLTIAVSRKISMVPPDTRGELGYLDAYTIPTDDLGGD